MSLLQINKISIFNSYHIYNLRKNMKNSYILFYFLDIIFYICLKNKCYYRFLLLTVFRNLDIEDEYPRGYSYL